jgi:hypothetical protein
MTRVEPSGIVLKGTCHLQTPRCTAKDERPLTAVWGPPGRTQIDIRRVCLEEKIRLGEWEVEGARLREYV